ncbi:MAG: phosphate ABC transporter permease subunit PstC [bacterium]|nr:phosphate ABC transporter permease subunit PstC [bacterium]
MRRLKEKAIHLILFLTAISSVFLILGIFALLLTEGLKTFRDVSVMSFLFGIRWNPEAYGQPSYGILSMVFSTFLVTSCAIIIAGPLGVAVAAYISEGAPHKARDIIKGAIEILAGIPSVAIGFVGIVLVGPLITKVFGISGLSGLNGGILLAIMALPTIISVSEDSLRAVPKSYKEASFALGASKWETLTKTVLPAAFSGICAGVVLGIGRAIGETMTVLMVTGNSLSIPKSIFDPLRTMTATIALELGEVAKGTTHYYAIFGIGAILFIISLATNLIAEHISIKMRVKVE